MFNFRDLDVETRNYMLDEFDADVAAGTLYESARFNDVGRRIYVELMRAAITEGSEATLIVALQDAGAFNSTELRKGTPVAVPVTAARTFAEGEFGRFYARAVCRRALAHGRTEVQVYRAKEVGTARSQSVALIDQRFPAVTLLDDLRINVGMDTALGLPPGPNSGLNVLCVCDSCLSTHS